jgi:hypothetical protein
MTTLAIQTTAAADREPSRTRLWTGRVLSGLAVLFLSFDAIFKLANTKPAVEGTVKLGYPPDSLLTIGLLEAICVALYVYRRTAPLGAVLLTGFLGGAVATHLRLGDPLATHTLFPVYVASFAWGGLLLRDGRIGALLRGTW